MYSFFQLNQDNRTAKFLTKKNSKLLKELKIDFKLKFDFILYLDFRF